jgi:hypothetical protein
VRLATIGIWLLALTVSGCGALFSSQETQVSLSSTPVGADVLIDGNLVGQTPFIHEFKNNKDHAVTFRMAGHKDQTCMLTKSVRPGIVILDVLGGLIPVVVDAATGSWYKLDKANCTVMLHVVD